MRASRCTWFALAALVGVAVTPVAARAEPPPPPEERESRPAVLVPTRVVTPPGALPLAPADAEALATVARGIDAQLTDAAQDLDLSVDLSSHASTDLQKLPEAELPEAARARRAALVVPTLTPVGADIELRLALALPEGKVLRVVTRRIPRDDAGVRAAVMLRDLVGDAPTKGVAGDALEPEPAGALATPARSGGRATLAVNASLFGGFVGYSIQRSSGSTDPRLLYPLLALGAGIGLGGSIIVAEEWDVSVGDAWYLAGGAWWPTLAGQLVYEGRFAKYRLEPDATAERWEAGLVGASVGVTLSTFRMALTGGATEGGALLASSGAGLGLIFGGLTELAARGDIYSTPFAGMGYGAALGWLAAATIAPRARVSPGRVLAVDLGAVLGGLGGAALGSPLLFNSTPTKQRLWIGAAGAGALIGGGIAWGATKPSPRKRDARRKAAFDPRLVPWPGVVAESEIAGRTAPALGLTWEGELE